MEVRTRAHPKRLHSLVVLSPRKSSGRAVRQAMFCHGGGTQPVIGERHAAHSRNRCPPRHRVRPRSGLRDRADGRWKLRSFAACRHANRRGHLDWGPGADAHPADVTSIVAGFESSGRGHSHDDGISRRRCLTGAVDTGCLSGRVTGGIARLVPYRYAEAIVISDRRRITESLGPHMVRDSLLCSLLCSSVMGKSAVVRFAEKPPRLVRSLRL